MTTQEKENVNKAIDAVLANRKGTAPSNIGSPILDEDVFTFALAEGKHADSVLTYHEANGEIREYFTVASTDREISQTQLCRNPNNGLGLVGDTPDERLKDFLMLLEEKRTLQIKCVKSRVAPSTNPKYNGTRIVTWAKIAR